MAMPGEAALQQQLDARLRAQHLLQSVGRLDPDLRIFVGDRLQQCCLRLVGLIELNDGRQVPTPDGGIQP